MELHTELIGFEPKIWRRIQIPSNITMARFAYVLMGMYEMKASHLFRYEIPYKENTRLRLQKLWDVERLNDYLNEAIDPLLEREVICEIMNEYTFDYINEEKTTVFDATQNRVKDCLSYPEQTMIFNYDFGDSWDINIRYEKEFTDKELPTHFLPRILDGRGYGIIEDVGGIYGLGEFVRAFKEKKGDEYEEYSRWYGKKTFNIEKFDLHEMNFRLQRIPRIYARIYEKGHFPTTKEIKFLEREYY